MKKLIEKILGAKVYAKHTEIKGNKSGGVIDKGSYQHWRKDDGEGYSSTN